jgi:predicted metal-dependent phosphoesterase TrpH
MAGPADAGNSAGDVAFVDLHCHSNASFDCLSDPVKVARAAARRGITHLAITDHDRVDGALRARDEALAGLTVIVGEEVRTTAGDLICLFLDAAVRPGLSPAETVALVREQGGLVGIPHPFDRYRSSMANAPADLDALAGLVDWVEAYNARVVFREGNESAAAFALRTGLPGVAVSDAHSLLEVGVASTRVVGDPSTPSGLLLALATAEVQPGRAAFFVRGVTPFAKLVQRARGNGRARHAPPGDRR